MREVRSGNQPVSAGKGILVLELGGGREGGEEQEEAQIEDQKIDQVRWSRIKSNRYPVDWICLALVSLPPAPSMTLSLIFTPFRHNYFFSFFFFFTTRGMLAALSRSGSINHWHSNRADVTGLHVDPASVCPPHPPHTADRPSGVGIPSRPRTHPLLPLPPSHALPNHNLSDSVTLLPLRAGPGPSREKPFTLVRAWGHPSPPPASRGSPREGEYAGRGKGGSRFERRCRCASQVGKTV